ncbi:hypothetical protein QBC34DRAFT_452750 [Podospora aff. communis PSN243]|uniref:Heterokaryon incompatibility domain-containing protein n=1 Tax=Podospora aff. communis PSN243 TaxID=3040156 RepID=A0AAV9G392_9PEZI|nr:hypothetical protein QBC34DRAFT_452750 [Podospora aff. communis PSN243]
MSQNPPTPASASLCTLCQDFNIQSFALGSSRTRGYRLADVQSGAKLDPPCGFCALLFDIAKDLEPPMYFTSSIVSNGSRPADDVEMWVHLTASENYCSANVSQGHGLRVNRLLVEVGDRFGKVRQKSDEEVCFAADDGSAAASNGDIAGRYLGRDPSSSEVFSAIRSCIGECSDHAQCNETVSGIPDRDTQQPILPSRTIKIQDDGSLILSENNDLRGAYITATHRWNTETEACKTTTDNYRTRTEGRGLGPLPQLFNDMITVARHLGIRHLWIDSICIVQFGDGGADWDVESLKMAQYYQHSFLTIAGTMPMSTSASGILQPLPESFVPWASSLVRLPYRDPSHALAGHFFAYKRRTPLVNDYWASVRRTAILKRGWILQEWLLSRRILWYTPSGVFFECRGALPRTMNNEKIQLEAAPGEFRGHLELKPAFHHSNSEVIEFWYRAVEVYSGCELTKPQEDRVRAVAGVARGVYDILAEPGRREGEGEEKFRVLAGIWAHDLCHGLLWQVDDGQGEHSRVRVTTAPSWSWTSTMSRVIWPKQSQGVRSEAALVGVDALLSFDTRVRYTGAEYSYPSTCLPFDSANVFACLRLRGRLYPVHVWGYFTVKDLEKVKIATGWDGGVATSGRWRAICSPTKPEAVAGWASVEGMEEGPDLCADRGVAVHALLVSTRRLGGGWLSGMARTVLDILLLAEDERTGTYKRLGAGRIMDWGLIQEMMGADEEVIRLL